MIKSIIFDLSEVYLNGIIGSEKYLKKELRIPISKTYFYTEELDKLFLGEITENNFWNKIIKKYGWITSSENLQIAIRKNFKEIKGTKEIIEALSNKGYTLYLLSNHAKEWIEFCETKYNYSKYFDKIVYSYDVKLLKPDEEIFLLLLKRFNLIPQETLFIDDNKENISTARDIGFNTIQFTSPHKLKKELIQMKIFE